MGDSKCSVPALQSEIPWNVGGLSYPFQRSPFPHQETRPFQKLTTFQVPKGTGNFLFHLHPQVHRIQKGLSTSRKTESLQTDCYKLKRFTDFKDYTKSSTMDCSSVLKHFSTSAISFGSCGILAHSKPGTVIKMGLFYIF